LCLSYNNENGNDVCHDTIVNIQNERSREIALPVMTPDADSSLFYPT